MSYITHPVLPGVWHLEEAAEHPVFATLVAGQERAVLFDACYGAGDLAEAVRRLTPLPCELVLSHHHPDHTHGAWQFPDAWIHPADLALCLENNTPAARAANWADSPHLQGAPQAEYAARGCCPLRPLAAGQVFELGGRTLEVVAMPGHTKGSVGILLRQDALLLVGDAANATLWMFFEDALPLSRYADMLDGICTLPFERFLISHRPAPFPKARLRDYIAMARGARLDNSENLGAFMGVPYPVYKHSFGAEDSSEHAYVLFSADKLD